jgi:hypothetical protein
MRPDTITCCFINKHVYVVRVSCAPYGQRHASIVCCVSTSRELIILSIRWCWNCCLAVMNLVQLLVSAVLLHQTFCQWIVCQVRLLIVRNQCRSRHWHYFSIFNWHVTQSLENLTVINLVKIFLTLYEGQSLQHNQLPSTGPHGKPEKSNSHSRTFIFKLKWTAQCLFTPWGPPTREAKSNKCVQLERLLSFESPPGWVSCHSSGLQF